MSINQTKNRYFLLTAEMLISEELTKVVIAKDAEDAQDIVRNDFINQNFSDWVVQGHDIKSAMELTKFRELTEQEYGKHLPRAAKLTSQH